MKTKLIAVGADPEVFLHDPEENLNIPAIELIGGTKASPKFISDKGHAVQEDNVMAEFNIPPSETEDDFVGNIEYAISYLHANVPKPLELLIVPTCQFLPEFLEEEQAQIAGCDPFINAWTGDIEEVCVKHTNKRSGGGHIHASYVDPNEKKSRKITKYMDLALGVPSVILDKDEERRKTYGKAGAFRVKDYGVEYRTLSNFWVANEKLMRWAYRSVELAFRFEKQGIKVPDKVQNVINTSNKTEARKLIKEWNLLLP